MRPWPRVTLGQVLKHRKEFILLDDTEQYKRCRVQLHAKGVVLRDTVPGSDIKTKRQQVCHAGEFLVAEIDAKMGGFGIVPEALEGAVVSSHYFLFAIDGVQLDRRFLDYFIRTTGFRNQVEAQGSTNYAAIRPASVAGYQIPLPPLPEQQAIVRRLDALADKVRQVNEHIDAIERDADQLLAVRFRDAIAEAPMRPMAEVAPLVRREIAIELEGSYPELGIRSFGKGTFHKPPLSGADVGTKRLFSIEPGDLLFSNVFAWEGAIAIAQPGDAGRFGSHRFITCHADPDIASVEFLRYYFLTDAGLEKIGEASPGGAGRNRTLGLEKLMAIQVSVPPLSTQRTFDALQAKVAELKARHATIRQTNDALIPATLERIFQSGEAGHE
ncbi:MAG: restriction endonuclease subunit S [Gammaproteobacteria bacterium]|nr:restriction endonuclease subunit S [Gammaproteobacteria bacterium]